MDCMGMIEQTQGLLLTLSEVIYAVNGLALQWLKQLDQGLTDRKVSSERKEKW